MWATPSSTWCGSSTQPCQNNNTASLHLGATTQDIMDTGLAIQLDAAMAVLERRRASLGDALAARVAALRRTP